MSPLAYDTAGLPYIPDTTASLAQQAQQQATEPILPGVSLPATGLDDTTGQPWAPTLPVTGPAGLALIPALPPELTSFSAAPTLLHDELRHLISEAIVNHPRSQQTAIGPSEVGTPCTRRLAWKLGELPEVNHRGPAWRPTVGTAIHAWMADRLVDDNVRRGFTRWLVEQRVNPGDIDGWSLLGNADGYDRVTGDVFDWKFPGITTVRDARRNGPKPTYKVQGHLYGRGWRRRGLPVRNVHVLYLPAAGELSDGVWWTEPYDEQVAVDALDRASHLARAGKALPGGYRQVGALASTAADFCEHCPYYAPADPDPAAGRCPGDPGMEPPRSTPTYGNATAPGVPAGLGGLIPAPAPTAPAGGWPPRKEPRRS